MDDIFATTYIAISLSFGWLLFGFIKRSEFGLLVGYVEMFTFFGAFLYPALLYSGAIAPAGEGESFLSANGRPGLATLFHVTSYLLGALLGFFWANRITGERKLRASYSMAESIIKDEEKFFKIALFLGIGFLALYLTLIGWNNAIAYAASMRSKDFENISEVDQNFLFLKSLAFIFTFIVCFIPSIVRKNSARVQIILYLVFVVMLYLVSISRTVILLNFIVPLLIYLRIRIRRFSTFVFVIACTFPIFLLFMFYGKPLGFLFFKLITEGELVSIDPYLSEYGLLNAFFGNFEFIWFSIEAGTKNFQLTEIPFLPYDLVLSVIGFIPSRVLDFVGLPSLNYRTVQPLTACLNSQYFNLSLDCTIPPRDLGLTAYILPLSGAFILGFVKYFIFKRQEKYFIYIASLDYAKTWYPILVVILWAMFFSFIPTAISQLVFLLSMLLIWYLTSHSFRIIRVNIFPSRSASHRIIG